MKYTVEPTGFEKVKVNGTIQFVYDFIDRLRDDDKRLTYRNKHYNFNGE